MLVDTFGVTQFVGVPRNRIPLGALKGLREKMVPRTHKGDKFFALSERATVKGEQYEIR